VRPPPPPPPEHFPGNVTEVQVRERGAWRNARRNPREDRDGLFFIVCVEKHKDPKLNRTLLVPRDRYAQPALPYRS
jgi:hypothetical protein